MYTILSQKTVFSGRIFDVVQQQVDVGWWKIKTFEKAVRSPGTRLIIHDAGKVLLTKEYRIESGGYDYRLPWGKVFDTLEEYKSFLDSRGDIQSIAQIAALKEAKEEVGVTNFEATFFACTHAGATIDRDLYYFVLNNIVIGEQELETGEHITYERYSIADATAMCLDGSIQEERSAMTLLSFFYQHYSSGFSFSSI